MATVVQICNRALQKLGAKRIQALDQDSVTARACAAAYDSCLDAELRKHPWSFATKRASLAADATAPDWGRENAFELPSDFVKLLRPYPEDASYSLDSVIEGRKIYSDVTAPLYIRYTARITDPNLMDGLFREVLAVRLAVEMCEELTQSNTKKVGLKDDYKEVIAEAKKANAFEKIPTDPPIDDWESKRA